MNGIWSSTTKTEQTLHNAKLYFSCAEFIENRKNYYLNLARKFYNKAIVNFKNIPDESFVKNKELICELYDLLFCTQKKWHHNLFSIEKISKTRKIITILGIKIKLKRTSGKKYLVDWNNKKEYINNIKKSYKNYIGCELDLNNPKTFTEKLMWLRAYDNTPLKTKCADKYEVRSYAKEKIGEKYLIPLIGVYDKFDDINFEELPNRFVIKCNHGSGYNIIVKDKHSLDKKKAKEQINSWMKTDYGKLYGEIHYSGIKPRIIIEEYLCELGARINDYKIWCCNGKAIFLYVAINDSPDQISAISLYDLKFNKLPIKYGKYNEITENLAPPKNLENMVNIAETLAKDFKFVRVDFFNINETILFSELTFTPGGGYCDLQPAEWNLKLGEFLDLR